MLEQTYRILFIFWDICILKLKLALLAPPYPIYSILNVWILMFNYLNIKTVSISKVRYVSRYFTLNALEGRRARVTFIHET